MWEIYPLGCWWIVKTLPVLIGKRGTSYLQPVALEVDAKAVHFLANDQRSSFQGVWVFLLSRLFAPVLMLGHSCSKVSTWYHMGSLHLWSVTRGWPGILRIVFLESWTRARCCTGVIWMPSQLTRCISKLECWLRFGWLEMLLLLLVLLGCIRYCYHYEMWVRCGSGCCPTYV